MSEHLDSYIRHSRRLGILGGSPERLNVEALSRVIGEMDQAWYNLTTDEKRHFDSLLHGQITLSGATWKTQIST